MPVSGEFVFTVEEANRTLPLVSSIVADVAQKWGELIQVREEYGNSSPDHDRIMRELAEYAQELKSLGCHLKDFELGLVEFPGTVRKRRVLLSWKLGEEDVAYMYRGDQDPSERVPIPDPATKSGSSVKRASSRSKTV
jgi:hypothetical protein